MIQILERYSVLLRIVFPVSVAIAFCSHPKAFAGATSYTYDVHGRLTTVIAPNGNDQSSTVYSFDNADNRTGITTTYVDRTPPNAPTGLVASPASSSSISLTWNATTDVGGGAIANYKVYRGGSFVGAPTNTSYLDQPLSANTPYTYTVSAVDPASNESAVSSPASATTPPGADLVPPSVPTGLQGSAVSGTWVNLTWSASTDTGGSGLAGYEIFRNNGATPIGSSTVASYADQTASPATTYQYNVRAYDVAGNRSSLSNPVSVTTIDTIAPGAPGTPTFSAIGSTTATASWAAATDNVGVSGYRYSLNGGASWTTLGNLLTANLSGLSLATAYTLQVQARDAVGNWGPSSSGSFSTAAYYTDSMSFVGGIVSNLSAYTLTGYSGGMGSITPATTTNGRLIAAYWSQMTFTIDETGAPTITGMTTLLNVTGFAGNPGSTWLQSVQGPGGVTFTGATATFGCTSSSDCSWSWPDYADLSGTSTLTIIHK